MMTVKNDPYLINYDYAYKVANLIASYYTEQYKKYLPDAICQINPFKEELFSHLKRIKSTRPNEIWNILYLDRHGIFFHYEQGGIGLDENKESVYVGFVKSKSNKYENYVCQINHKGLNGIDYVENELEDIPTVVKQVGIYSSLPIDIKFPRTLINRTGIFELFQLAVSDFGRINKNSMHFKDDPEGFPEKEIYMDLYNFMGNDRDPILLTDKLIDEVLDMENPHKHKIVIAIEEYVRDM